jgi:hypothetical protein
MGKANKPESKIFNFQIKSVELIKQNLELPETKINPITSFNFNIGVEQKLDYKNKLLIVITHVEITPTENLDLKLGSASVACVFSIENFEEVIKSDKKGVPHVDEIITQTLNSISISTSRGVLSQVFKGTFLHQAVLPVLDPKAFKAAPIAE